MKIHVFNGEMIAAHDLGLQHIPAEWLARKLSRLHRWGGERISVAQHSVMLWEAVPPSLKKIALLHDVPEVWVGEIPTPIKKLAPQIIELENYLLDRLCGLHSVNYSLLRELHAFDKQLGNAEAKWLWPGQSPWEGQPSLNIEINAWTVEGAAQAFHSAYLQEFGDA